MRRVQGGEEGGPRLSLLACWRPVVLIAITHKHIRHRLHPILLCSVGHLSAFPKRVGGCDDALLLFMIAGILVTNLTNSSVLGGHTE